MAKTPKEKHQPCPTPSPSRPASDRDPDARTSRVGDYLRDVYDDALAEPVPEIFKDLLRKLG